MSIFNNIKDQLRELIDLKTNVVNIRTYVNRNTAKKELIINNTIKSVMSMELDKALLLTDTKKMSVKCYSIGEYYYILAKVPSTTRRGVLYDVVFRVSASSNDKLTDREVKVFSNDPSFIYKYAYVFNKMDLIVPELTKLLPSECLSKKPETTNPNENVTAHKASMMAGIYLLDRIKIDTIDMKRFAKSIALNDLFSMLQNFNKVMDDYQSSNRVRIKKLKNI